MNLTELYRPKTLYEPTHGYFRIIGIINQSNVYRLPYEVKYVTHVSIDNLVLAPDEYMLDQSTHRISFIRQMTGTLVIAVIT
jgi:hypothetical protein